MAKIFISYRRDDCRDHVERIHDRLVRDLKGHKIFLDVDNIPGASHYEIILKDAVTECDVFLGIMGENWVDVSDPRTGHRRLEDPNDFVRIEVETALKNNKTKVIPVIAHDARIPQSGELPEPIQELVKLQFVRVRRNPDFHRDMDNLVNTVRDYLPREQRISPLVFLGSIAAAVLATVLVMYLFLGGGEEPEKVVETLNPSAVAVVLLTSAAETANAPTLTPTIDITQTINAIMQGIITEQATKQVMIVPTDIPTESPTQTSTPTASATATPTQDKTGTAAVQETQTQMVLAATREHVIQESQLTANVPTNTPRPTATATRTSTPT
ncbi:MAG: TIR domain-containing protein, partial [Anaerolineae bacterium]|nr:TIR domain-containing protein [Anaerolineae bacterium]